jgi:leader peptidase (prepilin peptidase)/N-methyltransferase
MRQIKLGDIVGGAAGLVAAAASLWAVPGIGGVLGAGLALLMLAIALIDRRAFIIPDELTVAALGLGIAYAALADMPTPIAEDLAMAALRGAATLLFFWGLRLLYRRLRGREGLGLGDVKLALVAGVWLDWTMIPVAIEIAALGALAAYAVSHLAGRTMTATSRLPFGLFFAPAIWLAWLLGALLFGA